MQTKAAAATLSVTIELNHGGGGTTASPAEVDAARGRLLSALLTHGLSATWGLTDPTASASTRALLNSTPQQEVALLVDGDGRGRLATDVAPRLERARAQGLRLHSVVLRNGETQSALDALGGQGVKAVRLPASDMLPRMRGADHPANNRGVYVAPVAWRVASVRRWWQPWNLSLQLNRRLASGELHVALDAEQMAKASRQTWTLVDRLLLRAGQQQRRGRLRVVTLGQLAEEHLQQHSLQPQRSILRAA